MKKISKKPTNSVSFVFGMLPYIIPVGLTILVIIKAFSVSHGNVVTMQVLVSSKSLASIIVSTIITSLLTVLVASYFISVIIATESVRENEHRKQGIIILAFCLSLAFFIVPGDVIVVMLKFAGLLLLSSLFIYGLRRFKKVYKRITPSSGKRLDKGFTLFVLSMMFCISLLIVCFNDTPWIPPETVKTSDNQFFGYVIDYDSTVTKLLIDESRLVIQIPNGDIKQRRICHTSPVTKKSVFSTLVWGSQPTYDKCL